MADGETPLKSTTPIPVPVPMGNTSTGSEVLTDAAATTGAAGTPSIVETAEKDVTMADAPSPAPNTTATTTTNAPSPAPAGRTGTPLRNTAAAATNGLPESNTSRAASQHPDLGSSIGGFTMPAEAPAHGAPTRQYLNSKVTEPLLEGLKALARDKPKDPLRVLGEFLIQRSKELETSN